MYVYLIAVALHQDLAREQRKLQNMKVTVILIIHIYPTPPLRQDMTQGQFLSEV